MKAVYGTARQVGAQGAGATEQSCGSEKGEGKAREHAQEGRDRVRGRIQNPQSEECGPRTQQGWSTGANGTRGDRTARRGAGKGP